MTLFFLVIYDFLSSWYSICQNEQTYSLVNMLSAHAIFISYLCGHRITQMNLRSSVSLVVSLVVSLILLGLFLSCRQKSATAGGLVVEEQLVDSTSIKNAPALKGLNSLENITIDKEVESIINGWPKFRELDNKIVGFKTVNRPRLFSYVEETETLHEELLETEFPEQYDIPQIKSRFLVFKTLLLRLKDHADDSRFSDESLVKEIKDLVDSFNAIKQQMINIGEDNIDEDEYLNQQ